jgi:hypothetical protein
VRYIRSPSGKKSGKRKEEQTAKKLYYQKELSSNVDCYSAEFADSVDHLVQRLKISNLAM